MVVIHKTPIPPPKRDAAAAELKRPTLTAEQQGKEAFVLQHFAAEDYLLPDVPEDKRMLTEDEQFWLVSNFGCSFTPSVEWTESLLTGPFIPFPDEGMHAQIPARDEVGSEGCCDPA